MEWFWLVYQGANLEQEREQREQRDKPTGEDSTGWEEGQPVEHRVSSSHGGQPTSEHLRSCLLVS